MVVGVPQPHESPGAQSALRTPRQSHPPPALAPAATPKAAASLSERITATSQLTIAQVEKHGPACPVQWGARREGTRLKSVADTPLSGCCALCRAHSACTAFNHDLNQGRGRCYLLSSRGAPRQVHDAAQRAVYSSAESIDGDSCSCAKIGQYVYVPPAGG